jgi:DNA-binding NarL/FixJ family response regulator
VYIERAVALGAAGFLQKYLSAEELTKAVREANNGKRLFSRAIFKRVAHGKAIVSLRQFAQAERSMPRVTLRGGGPARS